MIDMRYEHPFYMMEAEGAADLISNGRLRLGISRGSPEQVIGSGGSEINDWGVWLVRKVVCKARAGRRYESRVLARPPPGLGFVARHTHKKAADRTL